MKVYLLYFEQSDSYYVCESVIEIDGRWYRKHINGLVFCVRKHSNLRDWEAACSLIKDTEMYDYFMRNYGRLEGTYGTIEI